MGRKRNSPPTTERRVSPEKEVNGREAEISLPEKEFREMIIRWMKRMEDKFDSLSQTHEEVKKNQEELNKTHEELSKTHEELSKTHEEVKKNQEQLNKTHEELSKTHEELSKTHEELKKQQEEMQNNPKAAVLNLPGATTL